ncbi:MAG: GNAT family N-acetyltransferase [Candidatus Moranbacteria bacterium]|nr:GNAT family N-acetyltransferase [Candidatus Moranbacteria bacterium]
MLASTLFAAGDKPGVLRAGAAIARESASASGVPPDWTIDRRLDRHGASAEARASFWHPLAVCVDDEVVGFVMWAIDPADRSGWLGGLTIDRRHQGRGYGAAAVGAVLRRLKEEPGCLSLMLVLS